MWDGHMWSNIQTPTNIRRIRRFICLLCIYSVCFKQLLSFRGMRQLFCLRISHYRNFGNVFCPQSFVRVGHTTFVVVITGKLPFVFSLVRQPYTVYTLWPLLWYFLPLASHHFPHYHRLITVLFVPQVNTMKRHFQPNNLTVKLKYPSKHWRIFSN